MFLTVTHFSFLFKEILYLRGNKKEKKTILSFDNLQLFMII